MALIEHWDGISWQQKTGADPGNGDIRLLSVSALAPNDVWAVGYYTQNSARQTLAEHWNGTAWTAATTYNQGVNNNVFRGVTAIATNDVWVVGDYVNQTNTIRTLIEHWDGTAWSLKASADASSDDNILYGVSAISANDIWAVGDYNTGTSHQTLTEHWDGTQWTVKPSPNAGNLENHLYGVSALSSNDVWAVGKYAYSTPVDHTLIEHWPGSVWDVVVSADEPGGDNQLNEVSALGAVDVWAVGEYTKNSVQHTLLEHFGLPYYWQTVPSPNVGTGASSFAGVDAIAPDDVWAVGYFTDGSVVDSLVERYSPCTAPGTGTPVPTSTPIPLPTQCAVQFEDVPNPSTYFQYAQCLACRGIISGYACGGAGEPCDANNDPYFRPNNNVTRGQIAKFVALSAGINTPVSGQSFEDVPPGSTFYTYVEQLHALGVMGGYTCGGTGEPCVPPNNRPYFRPHNNATRGQLAKIDANTAGYNDTPSGQSFQDVGVGSTYYTYVQRLASRGIMGGYACGGSNEPCLPPASLPYFRPNNDVTRGQTSKIVANTFYPNCQAP